MRGVIFDFHDTLFRHEGEGTWVAAAVRSTGRTLPQPEIDGIVTRIREAWDERKVREAQVGRDRSPRRHREATTTWLKSADIDGHLIEALYTRMKEPKAWIPHVDAKAVLSALVDRRIPIGLLSNTGWDLRPTLEHHGLGRTMSVVFLSCELGIEKPDPRIFRLACAALGSRPSSTLMVGDNPDTDGQATRVGMPTLLLPPDNTGNASGGLRSVLSLLVYERERGLLES